MRKKKLSSSPPGMYRMITDPNAPGIETLKRRIDILDFFGPELGQAIKDFVIGSRMGIETSETTEDMFAEGIQKARTKGISERLVFQAGITANRLINNPLAPIFNGKCGKI